MRLKIFRAASMADAMAQLREELGAEAVILGTRRVGKGVEVTAALEPEEPFLIPPVAGAGTVLASPTGPLAFHNMPPALTATLGPRPPSDCGPSFATHGWPTSNHSPGPCRPKSLPGWW